VDINERPVHKEREKNAREFLCLIGPLIQPRTTWEHALPIIIAATLVISTVIMMAVAIAKF
jgi:hypothetical protein